MRDYKALNIRPPPRCDVMHTERSQTRNQPTPQRVRRGHTEELHGSRRVYSRATCGAAKQFVVPPTRPGCNFDGGSIDLFRGGRIYQPPPSTATIDSSRNRCVAISCSDSVSRWLHPAAQRFAHELRSGWHSLVTVMYNVRLDLELNWKTIGCAMRCG